MPAKQVRRKATEEIQDVERDLTDEGNPAELAHGGDAGDQIVKEEWEPLGSALEAGKAYANLKAIKDYFGEGGEGDLKSMDHPGMREGLKALIEDNGPIDKAMQHVKDLVSEHHGEAAMGLDGDAMMEKLCKSVEHLNSTGPAPYDKSVEQLEDGESAVTVDKDDSFEQGEANLVDSGVIPEGDLEPLDEKGELVDWAEEEEAEHEKQHGSDDDTEEILERYQHPKSKQWLTRVVGRAWRAKNGRIYVKVNKDLTDPGNSAKFNTPPETGAVIKDEDLDAIGKAADHLDAAADHPETPPMHKAAHSYHAKALREAHKSLSDMGNPTELEGPHKDLGPGSTCPECGYHITEGDIGPRGDAECPNCGWTGVRKDGSPNGAGGSDLTEGVQELKDLDEEPSRKTATSQAKKLLSPNVARALQELNETNAAVQRKARMFGIPLN